MGKRLSRQQKKMILELDRTGIAIEDVYGSKKASPLLLCLTKALIIFMVCVGTVTGFCDAFSLNYNRFTIVAFTLVCSVLISLLYAKKKIFYIGYLAFLLIFTLELIRYYLYANSGFQAITNRVREEYADHFDMSVTRTAEEYFSNRQLTITITLIFIISFLVIMYNITVSRYMNFAETFGISFILLQIPLYIGYKPPLISVILIMAGCICTGILQKGSFNRVTIPGKKAPDYIKDKIFKKTYYTTRGNHGGILLALGFSLAFSLVVCVLALPIYNREQGETAEDSAKAAIDDTVKILVQNGINGLFNSYDSLNGLNRGLLGGVSSVSPDFRTDIVVSFVPYSDETVYLPGFKGVTYHGRFWDNKITTSEFPELGLDNADYVNSDTIDTMDYNITSSVLKTNETASASMQIAYIDKSFGMMVYPYITYPGNIFFNGEEFYKPADPEKETVLETKEALYYPIQYADYITANDLDMYSSLLGEAYTPKISSSTEKGIMGDELSGRIGIKDRGLGENAQYKYLCYSDYIYDVCTKVPEALDSYLDQFCKDHNNFGLSGLKEYNALVKALNNDRTAMIKSADQVSGELFNSLKEQGLDAEDVVGNLIVSKAMTLEELKDSFEKKDSINEFRLLACEALKDMFLEEYPYTLSPGKTPRDEDFVQYFLESQKRGLCSHFASAAVMILRHLGIPARYIEGYCIPYSLVKENAVKLDKSGDYWFSAENEFNPEKMMYSVPVSDYCAHAWVEVYLEGKGFVPFEVTPPSFEVTPQAQEMTGIGRFFSQILNVDLGLGNDSTESSIITDAGETVASVVSEDEGNKELAILVKPLAYMLLAVFIFWMLILLIKKAVFELRCMRYRKEGKFGALIFIRFNELVNRLRRKKIVKISNPLPMELCEILSRHAASMAAEKASSSHEYFDKIYENEKVKLMPLFEYIEKVLYSEFKTDEKEYDDCYNALKNLPKGET